MNSSGAYPAWHDIEVTTLQQMLERGMWDLHEIGMIRSQIADRKAQILAGLGSAAQIYWTLQVQKLDEYCRVRHDPVHGWMLDRWIEDLCCWHPVGYIGAGGRLEDDKVVGDRVRPDLIAFLKAHDMQRPGYVEEKRAASEAIRDENERKSNEAVAAAVDRLTDRRIKNFIEVERAVQTGETIVAHGETERMLDRMRQASFRAQQQPETADEAAAQAINPDDHPLNQRRPGGGRHIRDDK
jgi:hypothetical protein